MHLLRRSYRTEGRNGPRGDPGTTSSNSHVAHNVPSALQKKAHETREIPGVRRLHVSALVVNRASSFGMPYYGKSEDWLRQSSLLLGARPRTTKVTTKYHIKSARRRTSMGNEAGGDAAAGTSHSTSTAPPPKPSRGHLVLKTYDPISGVVLKYKTSKAAEVSRLVQMLGQLGRRMASLPLAAVSREESMHDAPDAGEDSGLHTPVAGTAGTAQGQGGQAGGGGGKGKKKKGKR
ncbi:hypothetical protein P8C59_003895 [Phyllachora maydis]|uniref:SRP9 domain-containing protein n=1 Tax=Phyllachora maydis TaxID=1825666 RepID=A0AAD9I166_9PEZI|nr:hypothetical protein P8C59_003895 [Phyllachora maydis]